MTDPGLTSYGKDAIAVLFRSSFAMTCLDQPRLALGRPKGETSIDVMVFIL